VVWVFLGCMELTQLNALKSDPKELIAKITANSFTDPDAAKQYEPENHKIMEKPQRVSPEIVKDGQGKPIMQKDENGADTQEPQISNKYFEVCKVPSVIQKQIVDWAVQIAAGVPVELSTYKTELSIDEQLMFDMLQKTLRDNKMAYLDQHILRLVSIHKICAEIWYREEAPGFWDEIAPGSQKFKMRLVVLSPETGDDLYPVKDNMGKMIALGRKYIALDEDGKEINKFDLFTSESIQTYTEAQGSWIEEPAITLSYGKANFIVHQQPKTEWEDVQTKIERIEQLDSSVGDQNELSGTPLLAVKGDVLDFGPYNGTGKVFNLSGDGAGLEYIEPKGAHEAIEFERNNLIKDVFDGTNTPKISFDDAQGFGANIPGITLKLLFLPATLKAMGKQSGGWGMSVQRRYNFLMYAMATINSKLVKVREMEVVPRFQIFMPSNETELIENITKMVQAGLMSKKTAITQLQFCEDPEAEWKAIQEEAKALAAAAPAPTPPIQEKN
jgi:SPP1 family phage portal protein